MKSVKVTATYHQTITTRFVGPTNHRGDRIIAKCDAGRLVVSYDYALDSTQNHEAACHALASKLGWSGQWLGGRVDKGYVFVCAKRAKVRA